MQIIRIVGLWLVLAGVSGGMAVSAPLKAGVAKVDITPPPGVPLWGFAARKNPAAVGTLDSLFARVLVLDDGNSRIAVVTLDLGRCFGPASMNRLRDAVRKSSRISDILVTASHTHSGPRIRDDYPPSQIPEWEAAALDKIASAIAAACKQETEIRIGAGYGSAYIGFNRIQVQPDGTTKWFGRNPTKIPTSPFDPTVGVLRIDTSAGQPLAILVNYACHPVIFGHDNLKYSADFPAAMTRTVEQAFDGKPLCFFLQGAPGDINPYYAESPIRENGEKMRDWTGQVLGEEAARVAKGIQLQTETDGHLDFKEDLLDFHLRWDPAKFREGLLKVYGPNAFETEAPAIQSEMRLPVATLLINRRIAFMSMPGEPYVDFQIDWRNRCPVRDKFFVGYANGYYGYFPTIEGAVRGNYGGSSSTTRVEVGAGERMVIDALVSVYEQLGRLRNVPMEAQ